MNDLDWTALSEAMPAVAVEILDEVDSTNSLALERIRTGQVTSTHLLIARKQTAGRGQHQRSWFSSQQGIALSLLVPGPLTTEPLPPAGLLAAASGIAVRSAIAETLPRATVELKWPNDVLLERRKVAGILIESQVFGSRWTHVIGVGVNVNGEFLPLGPTAELARTAIHMQEIAGVPIQRHSLIPKIVNGLLAEVPRCRDGALALVTEYNRQHALRGAFVEIATSSGSIAGRCGDLLEDGLLQVESDTVHSVVSGTVVSWRPGPASS